MRRGVLFRTCTSGPICRTVILAIGLALALLPLASQAHAEEVIETWRSPFGDPQSVSVNSADGSCWVTAKSGVWHVAADGTILSQTGDFAWSSLGCPPEEC